MTENWIDELETITFEGVVNDNKRTAIYDELSEYLTPLINGKHMAFNKIVSSYIDRNTESLSIIGPYKQLLFIASKDENPIFSLFNVDKNVIKRIVLQSPLISSSFKTLTNPFFHLLTMINAIWSQSKDEKVRYAAASARIYMALRFYSSRQRQIFPFEAKPEVMEYTINNMTNRYLIKQFKSVISLLEYLTESNNDLVGAQFIKTHTDYYFKYFITNISTKINGVLDNIRDEYAKNYKEKNMIDATEDRHDDEHQTMKELVNLSSVIMSLSERVYYNLKANPMNLKIVKAAANSTGLSETTIKATLEDVVTSETSRLKELIISVLQLYFMSNPSFTPTQVKSRQFYMVCMNLYKTSNTINPVVIKAKQILDDLISDYGMRYSNMARAATLSGFRKSMYIYIVQSIILYS